MRQPKETYQLPDKSKTLKLIENIINYKNELNQKQKQYSINLTEKEKAKLPEDKPKLISVGKTLIKVESP